MNASSASSETDASGKLSFYNLRAEWWWKFREALDPRTSVVALPPDQALKAELTAPKWSLRGRRILVESKDDIKSRIGRSTNRADAVLLAMQEDAGQWFLKSLQESGY